MIAEFRDHRRGSHPFAIGLWYLLVFLQEGKYSDGGVIGIEETGLGSQLL